MVREAPDVSVSITIRAIIARSTAVCFVSWTARFGAKNLFGHRS